MKKTILEIYALAVCFFSVVALVVIFGIGCYSTISFVNPEFTLNSFAYTRHQSNDSFWAGCSGSWECGSAGEKKGVRPPELELSKLRLASFQRDLFSEERAGLQSIVRCLIGLICTSLVFLLHWFLAKRARNASEMT